MPLIRKIVIVLAVFASIIYLVASLLPSTWSVQRTIDIEAPPSKVFPLINNITNWAQWYPWSRNMDVSMVVTYEGPAAGVGAVRKWTGTSIKPGRIEIKSSVPDQSVGYLFTSEETELAVEGRLEISKKGEGSMVLWEDRGNLEKSVLARLFSRGIEKIVGPRFEEGLKQLKQVAESRH